MSWVSALGQSSFGHVLLASGESTVLWPTLVVVAIWRAWLGQKAGSLLGWGFWALAGFGSIVVMKLWFMDCEPGRAPFSPSGHAYDTALAAGLVTSALCSGWRPQRRWNMTAASIGILSLAMGLALVGRGDHRSSEVVLGALVGASAAGLAESRALIRSPNKREISILASCLLVTFSLGSAWASAGHIVQSENILHKMSWKIRLIQAFCL